MIPEPPPCARPRVCCICTVERRKRSEISPNPGVVISLRPPRALADGDRNFSERAASHQRGFHCFPYKAGLEHGLDIVGILDGLAVEGYQDVADHQTGALCRSGRL